MQDASPFGFWSLVPPLLAVGMAIITRRVVLSLFVAVAAGSCILAWGGGEANAFSACFWFLWNALPNNPDHLQVFAFSIFMGAMVGVIHKSGGMEGLVGVIRPLATTRRRGQLTSWLLGVVIFFDDYANTLLLGSTMRPVTDRLRISREKLAYIVDSTAAPIAGIALLSTWVATEVSFIAEGYQGIPVDNLNAFAIFVETIPLRFYPIWAFLFVALVGATRRDFGPMLAAEQRAASGGDLGGDRQQLEESPALQPDTDSPRKWQVALVPIGVVVATVMLVIYVTGLNSIPKDQSTELWNVIGNGNSYLALFWGSFAGLLTAIGLTLPNKTLNLKQIQDASLAGARLMLPALAVLWLAWALADVTKAPEAEQLTSLNSAGFMGDLLKTTGIAAEWMPTAIFLLAGFVAFCTGTSWGTMGILVPLAIKTTYEVLAGSNAFISADHPLILASIGSVLGGAIFGDHCSPISDTTVLSSRASGCPHMAHVWTQMPYALVVGAASVVLGTIPIGFGASVWVQLPLGVVGLWLWLHLIGRTVDEPES